ncbi:MAG: helix-turn-helix transcriptional regulator [Acidimicrobiales bacterium]
MRKAIGSSEHRRLCALLRKHRVDARLNQAELAERLDVPQSFISKYESGQRRLDLVELHQICDAVGVRLVDVVAAVSGPR